MRPSGVAPSDPGASGPGEARLLASGVLIQQLAQVSGLLVLLAIVTLLARRLTVAELGAYGLVASLSGYLLVFRNSVASSAVRAMAIAAPGEERSRTFTAAAALYALVGLVTGLLLALAAIAIAAAILEGELATDARVGGIGLGAVTGVGIASTVWLDALRAERLFVRSGLTEIAGVAAHFALMLTLILSGADLALVIALSGALPLWSGVLSALVARGMRLPIHLVRGGVERATAMTIVPTAGWLLVVELSNFAMYAFSRVILGVYRSPVAVGLFEGPVRAHNLFYALGGALAVPVVPTASRYQAEGDERRLRELAVRGTRYTLALAVPLCVALMTLAEPLLEVWLGDRYGDGATALTILVSYWLLYAGLVVTPGFLVGAGRARQVGLITAGAAALNLVARPRAHARARPRGAGARDRHPVPARLPADAEGRPRRVGGRAGPAGPARLAAGVRARGRAGGRARGGASGRRPGHAARGDRQRSRRRARLLGGVLPAGARARGARARARARGPRLGRAPRRSRPRFGVSWPPKSGR